jgi:inorganic pyrophosphatase
MKRALNSITTIDMTHPWHDVHPGNEAPELVTTVIEIPSQTRAKYEIDKETGLLKLDRVIFSSMYYPTNYGFIPRSYCGDKDPLDILVISQISMVPRCLVTARVIGVMRMLDQGDMDDKIIAVAAHDQSVAHMRDLNDLPEHTLSELRNFFEDYKKLENKTVSVEAFQGAAVARKIVAQSFEDYQTHVLPNLHRKSH